MLQYGTLEMKGFTLYKSQIETLVNSVYARKKLPKTKRRRRSAGDQTPCMVVITPPSKEKAVQKDVIDNALILEQKLKELRSRCNAE